jgi:hypothetical protein
MDTGLQRWKSQWQKDGDSTTWGSWWLGMGYKHFVAYTVDENRSMIADTTSFTLGVQGAS